MLKYQVLYLKLLQGNFVTIYFVISVQFTKITKLFGHRNLELYGRYFVSCNAGMNVHFPLSKVLLLKQTNV